MPRACRALVPVLTTSVMLVTACQNDSQAPRSRPEPPLHEAPESEMLAPLDLIYVCGNKFLATNATGRPVEVTYRVVGTEESGSLTLREPSGDDDGGHSETELRTRERGVVELYQNDQRVARRRNGTLPCGPSPTSASFLALTSSDAGSWGAPFPWPVVALHLSLLPNGLVLSWGNAGQPQLWNPNTGNFTEVSLSTELFCAGHTLLPDGRLLVAGGHISDNHGLAAVNIFSPGSQSWAPSGAMRRGRWYPTTTLLANGEVLIMAGADEAGVHVPEPEVWSSGSVRVLSTASLVRPYYPRNFLMPNGKVLFVGELKTNRWLDPTGTGTWSYGTDRLYGGRDYGAAVMYDVNKILYVGGGRTTNTAEILDLTAGSQWRWTGSMANPRRHLNATVLPTGEVLVTGGTSGTGFNDVALAVHAAELWNPTTGIWTVLAGNTINRTYHATSLLLPDGRVLHTGSGDASGAPAQQNAELFSPPYLFRGSRPTITAAPTSVAYNTTFQVTTPDAAGITKVSLIHLGSTTHAFDMGQRFQRLSFQRGTGTLTITGPTNPNVTPPGHYMLFIVNGNDVPSVAKIIRVGITADPAPPPNSAPTAAFSQSCTGLSCTFTDGSTDADGTVTGWSWDFGDNTSATTRNPGHTYTSGGTYTVNLVATDDDGATATTSQAVTVTAPAVNAAPTAAFAVSCTRLTCHFTNRSTDTDGSIVAWSWTFGNGASATTSDPNRSYASPGTYTVTLQVTDDDGATNQVSQPITITTAITLSASGRVDATKQYVTVIWSGARGTMVDLYRNRVPSLTLQEPNDGLYNYSRLLPGLSKYTFWVCEQGSTTICSNEASVVF